MNLEQRVKELEDHNLKLKEELNKIQKDRNPKAPGAKKARNELQLQINKFKAVFEQAAVGIGIVGFQDAKWIDVNTTFCKMLGYSEEEFKSTPWPEITHPEDINLDLVPFRKMAAGELNSYTVEKRFIHKKGHHVWTRLTLSLVRNEQGQPDFEVAIIENIHRRKEAEEALQRSEERWNLAIENFTEGAVIATEDEQVIYWNPAARELHGFSDANLDVISLEQTGNTFELWTTDKNHKLELDEWPMRRIKNGEKVLNLELVLSRPDQGWEKIVSYSGSMVKTAGGEKLIFLSIHDFTKQRKSELELKRSNDLLENILYILAHDLKGPIANMHMAANLINSVKDMAQKIKLMDMYKPQLERMDNTIEGVTGILQVQKAEESSAEKINMDTIVNEILSEFRNDLKPGELHWDFKKRRIKYIEPFLLSILRNLINNAIKYRREDISLNIEIKTQSGNGFTLLAVKDNGIGIDLEKHAEDLFSPFMRLAPEKAKGTGIGLYIIKTIVEKNGGYVKVESKPGEGTAFYCYLKEYDS